MHMSATTTPKRAQRDRRAGAPSGVSRHKELIQMGTQGEQGCNRIAPVAKCEIQPAAPRGFCLPAAPFPGAHSWKARRRWELFSPACGGAQVQSLGRRGWL